MAQSIAVYVCLIALTFNVGSTMDCHICATEKEKVDCVDPFSSNSHLTTCDSDADGAMQELLRNKLGMLPWRTPDDRTKLSCLKLSFKNGLMIRSCVPTHAYGSKKEFCTKLKKTKQIKYCGMCEKNACNGVESVKFSLLLAFIRLAVYLMH